MDKNKGLIEIASGSLWVLLGTIMGYILEYANKIIIARFFGPSDYGVIVVLITLISILVNVALLGLNIGVSRYIAYFSELNKIREIREVIFAGLKIIIISSSILSIIFFITKDFWVKFFIKKNIHTLLIFSFALIIPVATISEYLFSSLRGKKFVKEAIFSKEVIRRISTILILLPIVLIKSNINYIGFAYLGGYILYLVFTSINVKKIITFEDNFKSSFSLKNFVFFSLPLLFSFILKQLSGQIATIFISLFSNIQDVAFYSAALSFARLVSLPLNVILFMFVPVMTNLWATKKDPEYVFEKIFKINLMCSVVIFVNLIIFSKTIIEISFGFKFVIAYKALYILSLAQVFYSLCGCYGASLIAFGKSKYYFWGDLVSVIISFSLFPFFTKKYGFIGASYVILIRMIILGLFWLRYSDISKKILFNKKMFKNSLSVIIFIFAVKNFFKVIDIKLFLIYFVTINLIFILVLFLIMRENFNLLTDIIKGRNS